MYYPFGGGLASIWSKSLAGVNVKAEVTGGSLINVIQVARNESDLGIAMADVVTDGYLGRGRFPAPLDLRVLFAAYPNIVHIMTLEGSDITSVADLAGKRVSLGAAGSGTAIAAENIFAALSVPLDSFQDQYLDFNDTVSALKDGTIDAGFIVGGLGISAVMELSVTRAMKLIDLTPGELEKVTAAVPVYAPIEIPAGLYRGIDKPVAGLGIWSVVIVGADMPEDLAYGLSCTTFQSLDALMKVAQVARYTTPANVYELNAVPLHAGTARYLKEAEVARQAGEPLPVCDRAAAQKAAD